ncbi:MAG: hypothetical protein OXU66_12530 [Gammaproteobacteria bacterium]|nr:hypothetical protein [Gammaproteobacteria bacterium]MDD9897026.1 hypothetical protein [Gammaproteobacteria bacterium]MDD9959746.1 hypothetical protein [Gammaproteobacteria bacterium]
MSVLEVEQLSKGRKLMVYLGIALIIVAALMSLSVLVGWVEIYRYDLLGHSGLRTIAGVAVAGCLLAAIGYNDQ